MMKHIITPLIVVFCIVAGSIGGHFLKSRPAGQSGDSHNAQPSDQSSHGEKATGHGSEKPAASGGHGSASHGGGSSSEVDYYKFSREFVVPILGDGKVISLVILNINLEIDANLSQELYSMDPKLRDNIMTTLIKISNDGATFEYLTNVESYESIRAKILLNLQNVVPTGIRNILILDVARQDT